MLLLKKDSIIDYSQTVLSTAIINMQQDAERNLMAVFTNCTNFHPIDYQWPDQPMDQGVLEAHQVCIPIIACVMAAKHEQANEIFFDQAIPVKRGEVGWQFFVAHFIDPAFSIKLKIGDQVNLKIDTDYRLALSKAHSACHIASLALNKSLTSYWKASSHIHMDSLNHPHFDALAITQSKILPYQSVDTYRLGKSIRKKGLNSHLVIEELQKIAALINDIVAAWLKDGIQIDTDKYPTDLTARRHWLCQLADGQASIPCGGTHVAELSLEDKIKVCLEMQDETTLIMTTTLSKL